MSILYTYYGDDFTGSTDVLEQLGANGVPAVLFVGVTKAGASRHLQRCAGDRHCRRQPFPLAGWMSANLPAIFRALQRFGAPITHYKVCSTFDSSPTIGSIGRAIEIGREVFAPPFVPSSSVRPTCAVTSPSVIFSPEHPMAPFSASIATR